MSARIALKLGYIGTKYKGFQFQPNESTVEGELLSALRRSRIIDAPKIANYARSSRTDAGVHATSQVVAFDTDRPDIALPRVVNAYLPQDIWVWASAVVSDDFHPRHHALKRTYEYVLAPVIYPPITKSWQSERGLEYIREACNLMRGTHDFANFTDRSDRPEDTIRTVEDIELIAINHS